MKIVRKIEPGMDRNDVLCTTYQMRNFYRQFGDGFFTVLDVMNYIQHCYALKICRSGCRVLDVCCGRGLMLPLLRYHRKDIAGYVGVDIKESNAVFMHKRVTDGKPVNPDEYYPFNVELVVANAAYMSDDIGGSFETVLFMSSIEHMHREMGERAIAECRRLISNDGRMLITCPNTPEHQDGYNTQYAAHVYEWKRSELHESLERSGFEVVDEWGIFATKRMIAEHIPKEMYERLSSVIPSEWFCAVLAPLCLTDCKEVAMLARPVGGITGHIDDIDLDLLVKEYNERVSNHSMQ